MAKKSASSQRKHRPINVRRQLQKLQPHDASWRLNFTGIVVGLVFFCVSHTPSLLPVAPLFQGAIAGISFAVGYGLGVALSWTVRLLVGKELPAAVKSAAWWLVRIATPVLAIAYSIWAASWQNSVRSIMGEPALVERHIAESLAIAVVVGTLCVTAGRLIAWAIRRVSTFVSKWIPARLSIGVGIVVVGVVLYWVYSGILVTAFVKVTNDIYRNNNAKTNAHATKPQDMLHAGGNGSLISWDSLGRQGRNFIGRGPSQQQITDFSGIPAKQPIRVYAGLDSADAPKSRAQLAVRELKRTGAFERKVLCVITPTGTGWIEPQSADSLEYMWNGDTALVAMQYSYLPSWISFLVDQQNAVEAGQELFDAVYQEWQQIPSGERPKLIVYGLSLGAYGGQGAFSGADDLQNRTDGALFVGSPSHSQPWLRFTEGRDAGSPEWQPVYQSGRAVQFAANEKDIAATQSRWQGSRTLYLQHASDPVVWWNTKLILQKPGWLAPRGDDISPNMRWYPFVTFFQTSADQLFATSVPAGHGHNYSDVIVAAWATITQPEQWNHEKTAHLQQIINSYAIE